MRLKRIQAKSSSRHRNSMEANISDFDDFAVAARRERLERDGSHLAAVNGMFTVSRVFEGEESREAFSEYGSVCKLVCSKNC